MHGALSLHLVFIDVSITQLDTMAVFIDLLGWYIKRFFCLYFFTILPFTQLLILLMMGFFSCPSHYGITYMLLLFFRLGGGQWGFQFLYLLIGYGVGFLTKVNSNIWQIMTGTLISQSLIRVWSDLLGSCLSDYCVYIIWLLFGISNLFMMCFAQADYARSNYAVIQRMTLAFVLPVR